MRTLYKSTGAGNSTILALYRAVAIAIQETADTREKRASLLAIAGLTRVANDALEKLTSDRFRKYVDLTGHEFGHILDLQVENFRMGLNRSISIIRWVGFDGTGEERYGSGWDTINFI
jgi:Na+-transporting NADH:ubiquinone oxidoreductase subunit NqrC